MSSATITIPRKLLEELAPQEPHCDGEMGYCMCCGGTGPYHLEPGRSPENHDRNCAWLRARRLLEPTARDLKPDASKLTKAQTLLMDRLRDHNGRLPVRGNDLRVAEALAKKQLIRIVNNGEPWTKGWYREAVLEPLI